jgi:hypothetical protein
MVSRTSVVVVAIVACASTSAYEWRSHNRMAHGARHLLLDRLVVDQGLRDFVNDLERHGFGEDLDTRAGDAEKDAYTDEDHNEGELEANLSCSYRERPCWPAGAAVTPTRLEGGVDSRARPS